MTGTVKIVAKTAIKSAIEIIMLLIEFFHCLLHLLDYKREIAKDSESRPYSLKTSCKTLRIRVTPEYEHI